MTPEGIAAGFHQGANAVKGYMQNSAEPMLRLLLSPTNTERCLGVLFDRSLCWMLSLERLNNAQDFQAVAACVRSLLESTVDVILLCHDQSGESAERMVDWATSSKFKHCELAMKFYSDQGKCLPDEHQPMKAFFDQHLTIVPALRAKHWSAIHPPRWTGRNLANDCKEADALEPTFIGAELEMSLAELYESQIRRLNWNVHGSGLAGVQNVPAAAFYLSCALGYKWSADLAMLTTKLILRDTGFASVSAEIGRKWDEIRSTRLAAATAEMRRAVS
jgi:hypothetical protein